MLRVAHEFIGNAVKHGMHARVVGRIAIHLATGLDGRTALVVTDDGWGFEGSPDAGEGLTIAGDLAASAGGTVSLRRTHVTVAALEIAPAPRHGQCPALMTKARDLMMSDQPRNMKEIENENVDHESSNFWSLSL